VEEETDGPATSRRALVGGAAVLAAAAAVPVALPATPAEAGSLPRTRPYRKTPVPGRRARHLVQRFTYGYTPALRREVRDAGGPDAWFERQLHPGRIADGRANRMRDWFPALGASPRTAFHNHESGRVHRNRYVHAMQQYSLLRRTYSTRQVQEVMVEFWLNHLHVHAQSNRAWPFRAGYDATVRSHALGRFDALLPAAVTHPAMLRYLDQDRSTAGDLNENLGRELLELHTVGTASGYTEADVRESARILTGHRVDADTLKPFYDEDAHDTGRVQVLGFSAANPHDQGRQVVAEYLHYLAHHEATARRIAHKLAVRFVADDPPGALVERVAQAYLASGTNIRATLRALVGDPLFHSAAQDKVRTPSEDVCASLRALDVRIVAPTSLDDGAEGAHAVLWLTSNMGQRPYHWGTPDGFPDRSDAWASAARMLASFRVHHNLAGGYYPKKHVRYRLGAAWLPQRRIRFDLLVDHLCRRLHGRPSTPAILGAACRYLDVTPGTVVTRTHPVCKWRMPRLLGLLLDSPPHLAR
jgi:uncharacterized protein (DUF1800 family)